MHTLAAGAAQALIDPQAGGRVVSLTLDGFEVLGGAQPADGAPAGWFQGIFPMAPWAGRVKDGRFRFAGSEYTVPPNHAGHAGHGLVFDVPWRLAAAPAAGPAGMRCRLTAELDGRWPLGGRVHQTITLTPRQLALTLALRNDERAMPGALGFHPWFRRHTDTGEEAAFRIRPRRRYAPDADGFPRTLSRDLGPRPWDDVFQDLLRPATVSWPHGPRLTITADTRIWTVYERRTEAFCIEPLTAPPDTLGRPGTAVIRPGRPLSLTMRLSW